MAMIISQMTDRGKTLLTNIPVIANEKNFPPELLVAYIGIELMTKFHYSPNVSILYGKWENDVIQEVINRLFEQLQDCCGQMTLVIRSNCMGRICGGCNKPSDIKLPLDFVKYCYSKSHIYEKSTPLMIDHYRALL